MAENKEGQEKTELATSRRLEEAREKGQVSKSQDVTTAAMLLIGGLSVFVFGGLIIDNFKEFMITILTNLSTQEITDQNVAHYTGELFKFLAVILLPLILIIFTVALSGEVAQVGFKIASKKFTEGLRWKQIFNPFSGIKRIFFSSHSLFELAKSMAKIGILSIIVFLVLKDKGAEIVGLIERPFGDLGNFMIELSLELVWKVAAVYILIAFADMIYQKWKFKEDMKMTKQEIKDEHKQSEGDPLIKSRLRSIMRGRMRRMMMDKVPQADVVITNPTHFAVALKYEHGSMHAPVVVAKGADFLAARIKNMAGENSIPIVEDAPLARTIYFNVEVNDEIPETLFKAVAEVLAYVYHLKNVKS